jgi:FKBP-type peptidyl-prolyl cis-trans isomerase SlpA
LTDLPQKIAPGSKVTLHLSLTTIDKSELLSTFGEEPETLVMGDGSLPAGLELALYGLKPGAEQTLVLTPEQAFGSHTDDKIHRLSRSDFPTDMELKAGNIVGFVTPEGEEMAGTLLKIEEDEVRVDFNHPLAGMDVVFRVEIIDVITPTSNSMERH